MRKEVKKIHPATKLQSEATTLCGTIDQKIRA